MTTFLETMGEAAMNKFADLIGRILIALIFVMAGMNKVMHYDATVADMALHGIPGMLLPVVILTELVGGILIIIGLQTRLAALALAGFSVVTGRSEEHTSELQSLLRISY